MQAASLGMRHVSDVLNAAIDSKYSPPITADLLIRGSPCVPITYDAIDGKYSPPMS